MMAENHFQQRIQAYDRWKADLIAAIDEFRAWLDQHDAENGEQALSIYEAIESLKNDRLNIAFVAEFSRGKTELINAIFFADFQRRLLPSEAGRTTMCPTELFYDRKADAAYVRLLPIETRLQEASISELKQDPIHWMNIPLDIGSPEQMETALREVIRTKKVPVEQAERLGLYSQELYPHVGESQRPTEVEIPTWRHALISFPHQLLKRGLVILDTPGLNALGSEPELTMNMLPSAQAILFVLAADSGVTRSDLDVWQYHVEGRRKGNHKGVAVILNKVDTLWDELKQPSIIDSSIKTQVHKTAELLHVKEEQIFPVSAQKGLLAKIRGDEELLQRSRLGALEDYLCNDVLPARESILRERVVGELGALLEQHHQRLDARLQSTAGQLSELRNLSGKNADVILHLMQKTREEQTVYQKHVESFQSSRRLLQRQAAALMDTLSLDQVDALTNACRKSMQGSWTTAGLKRGMKMLFDGLRGRMEQIGEQTEQTRRLVGAIYKKFQLEHGLPPLDPRMFSFHAYQQGMEALYEEAEAFRKSPVTTMTEQNLLIKKFFVHLVSQARNLLFKANQEADTWVKQALHPLMVQIKEHKYMMERRLKTLRKISESRETLDSKIQELDAEAGELRAQLEVLAGVQERLLQPAPCDHSSAA